MAAYLKIDGLDGTSSKPGHKNEIEIESFVFGGTKGHLAARQSADPASRYDARLVSDLIVQKAVDSSSAKLLQAASAGISFPSVVMSLFKDLGKSEIVYARYNMTNVIISSYAPAGFSNDRSRPAESISFDFLDMKIEYL